MPGSPNVKPLTNVGVSTEAWVTGLNLLTTHTYYFTVRAKNGVGLYSLSASSNGITYRAAVEPPTIYEALTYPDSTTVLLRGKVVSGGFLARFYIEESDRTRGLAIGAPTSLMEGASVDVTGTLQTISGERVVVPGAVTPVQP